MDIGYRLMAATIGFVLAVWASVSAGAESAVVRTLAPTGKLRIGLYLGGPANVIRDPASGEMKGVGFDLGKELARRLDVPFEPIVYETVGAVVEAGKSGGWDIACLTATAERKPFMDFTAPFLAIEHGYLVTGTSPIKTLAKVDRPGIRVGVPKGGALEGILVRTLKNAQLVPRPGLAGVLEMLKSGQVDVFAANKANLFEMSDRLPGSRVLDGRIAVDQMSIAIPKGREAALPYLEEFIRDAKSEGLLKAAAGRAGLRGAIEE